MGNTVRHRELAVPVAETLTGALDAPQSQLPPLAETIDLEALDALIPEEPDPEVTVAFKYEGRVVLVSSGPSICVVTLPSDGAPTDADGLQSGN